MKMLLSTALAATLALTAPATSAPMSPLTSTPLPTLMLDMDGSTGDLLVEAKSRSGFSSSRRSSGGFGSSRGTKPRSTTPRRTTPRSTPPTTRSTTPHSTAPTTRSTTPGSTAGTRGTLTQQFGTRLPSGSGAATKRPTTTDGQKAFVQQRAQQTQQFQQQRRTTATQTRERLTNNGNTRGTAFTPTRTTTSRVQGTGTLTSPSANQRFVQQRRSTLTNRTPTASRNVNLRGRDRWDSYDSFYTPSVYYGARPAFAGGWGSPFYHRGGACYPTVTGLWSCNGGMTFLTALQMYWLLDNISDRNRVQQYATQQGTTTDFAQNQPSQEELNHVKNSGGMAFDEEGEAPADGVYEVNTYAAPLPEALSLRFCVGGAGNNYDKAAQRIAQYFPQSVDVTIVNTAGMPEIMQNLSEATCDMAFGQADGLIGAEQNVVSVLSDAIYPEYAHLVCTKDSGIREVRDLRRGRNSVAIVRNSGAQTMWENFGELDSGYNSRNVNVLTLPNTDAVARQMTQRGGAACTLMVSGKGSATVESMARRVDGRIVDVYDWDLNDDGQYEFGELANGDYPNDLLDTGMFSSEVDTMFTWASVLVRNDWFSALDTDDRQAIADAVEAAVPEIQAMVNYR